MRGNRRPEAKLARMSRRARPISDPPCHDRTARLLEDRLESLACACEHSLIGVRALDTEMLRAAVATAHAVRLSLLSPEEAVTIWAAVAERHPDVPSFGQGLELELLGPN